MAPAVQAWNLQALKGFIAFPTPRRYYAFVGMFEFQLFRPVRLLRARAGPRCQLSIL